MITVARPVRNAAKAWPAKANNDNKSKPGICATAMATTTRAKPVFVQRLNNDNIAARDKGKTRIRIKRTRARPATAKTTRAMPATATIGNRMIMSTRARPVWYDGTKGKARPVFVLWECTVRQYDTHETP